MIKKYEYNNIQLKLKTDINQNKRKHLISQFKHKAMNDHNRWQAFRQRRDQVVDWYVYAKKQKYRVRLMLVLVEVYRFISKIDSNYDEILAK